MFEEFDVENKKYLSLSDLMNVVRFINLNMSEKVVQSLKKKLNFF